AYDGGGIAVTISGAGGVGTFDLYTSTVADNNAADDGGGVHFDDSGSATFTIQRSTVSRNTSAYDDAGVWFSSASGYLRLINSTASGNEALDGNGGGVLINQGIYYYARVYNSTIASNKALKGTGGGIYADANVIFLSNIAGDNSAKINPDIGGTGYFYAFY